MTGLITTDKLLDVTVTIKYELTLPPSLTDLSCYVFLLFILLFLRMVLLEVTSHSSVIKLYLCSP